MKHLVNYYAYHENSFKNIPTAILFNKTKLLKMIQIIYFFYVFKNIKYGYMLTEARFKCRNMH